MAAKHGLQLIPSKEDLYFKIKHGGQYGNQFMIMRKKHGEDIVTKNYKKK